MAGTQTVRSLIVKVGADLTGFSKATGAMSKDLGKLSKKFDRMGQGMTNSITKPVLALGAGIGALVISGMKDAAEAEKYVAQLDAVLKSTGQSAGVTREQALGLADAFEKNTKFAAESTLEAENMLLTFTNIGKDVFPQATEMCLDMATAFGTDASASAIQLGKALNDPTKGLTALSRVGVTFTEEQKKQIKTLQESGDIVGAQTVILKELQKEFGGSAKAAGKTFAGQLEITKNMLGNVTEQIGTALLPTVQDFLKYVQDNMPKIEKAVKDFIPVLKNDIIPVIKDLGKFIGKAVEWFAGLSPETQKTIAKMVLLGAALGPVLSGVSGILGLASNFTGFLSGVSKVAGKAGAAGDMAKFAGSLSALVGPLGWITLVVAALWGLYEIHKKLKEDPLNASKYYNGLQYPQYQDTYNNLMGLPPTKNGMGDFKTLEKNIGPVSTTTVTHTGTITVKGVDSRGELVAVVEQHIADKVTQDNRRLPNRASLIPIS